MAALARALDVVEADSMTGLYWASRVCLVHRQSDLALFDLVFAEIFDDVHTSLDPHARRLPLAPGGADDVLTALPDSAPPEAEGGGLPWTTLPHVDSALDEEPAGFPIADRLPSELEGLADTPFDVLEEADLVLLCGWLGSALAEWPTRRTRRQAVHHGGRNTALRATLTRARRTGWEPIHLVRTRSVQKRRRVVMLCDVSQSMQAYATAYFHLMRAVALTTDAEVFAFATTLTRLTSVLVCKSPFEAVRHANEKVTDRFGGTRIASNIRALLTSRHVGAVRGAIVIIASDGWDSDPPSQMDKAMSRLHRLAHKVVWLNPRAAAPGFTPLVGGMSAAWPYCDHVLPAHNIRALGEVVDAIVSTSRTDQPRTDQLRTDQLQRVT